MKRASLSVCITALIGMLATAPAFGQLHFSDCAFGTGNNATILIPLATAPAVDGRPLEDGDEIAAFAESGECVGAVTWAGRSTALTVWGDDLFQEGKHGLAPGEHFELRIWSASSGVLYSGDAVSLTYSNGKSYYRTDDAYAEDALYLISSLSAITAQQGQHANESVPQIPSNTVTPELQTGLMQNYPNPFAQNTTIAYALGSDAFVQIEVVDLAGKMVDVLVASNESAGYHEIAFDAQALPSGVYLCRFAAGPHIEVRRMLLTR